MQWLRRLLGIPPAPVETFDHTKAFDPEARRWIEQNRQSDAASPASVQESEAVARRRREERRRSDDDFEVGAYTPAILDHTPSKTYSSGGHDSRDHTPAHSHTTHHDTHSYSDSGTCGSDGGGGGGCD